MIHKDILNNLVRLGVIPRWRKMSFEIAGIQHIGFMEKEMEHMGPLCDSCQQNLWSAINGKKKPGIEYV